MELMSFLRSQWDRTGAVVATALGLIVLLLGYLGTAGTEYIAEQIPYLISGGLVGIALLTIGAVLWISADLRDEWRELCEQGEAIRMEQLERRSGLEALVRQEVARQVADLGVAKANGHKRRGAAAVVAAEGVRARPVSKS